MKHPRWVSAAIGAVSLLPLLSAAAGADSQKRSVKADLEGAQEVPVISTAAEGEFRARVNGEGDTATLDYDLSYRGLEGGPVLFAHIHLGQPSVNGGVIVFLCSNSNVPIIPPAGTPPCPTPAGTVSGTVSANDVIGPAGQGIAAGEFAELLNAIREGNAYVNVHTGSLSTPPAGFPGGEIRGQVE
jgi:CHRD domain-containing protein